MASFPPLEAVEQRVTPNDYSLTCPKCQKVIRGCVYGADREVWYSDMHEEAMVVGDPSHISILVLSVTPYPLIRGVWCVHQC